MTLNVIATLSDRNYIDQAKQLFSSIYFNSGWKGDYLLLAQGLSDHERGWFTDRGIIIRNIDSLRIEKFPWLPGTVLGKFYLFDEWMKRWDQVLYIDSDATVGGSLDPLTELKGFWASPDFHDRKLRGQFLEPRMLGSDPGKKEALERLGQSYDLDAVSFNSGVMLFETGSLPEDPFTRSIEIYRDLEPIILHDQSVLNLLFYGKWTNLPLAYNNYHLYKRDPWSLRFLKCEGIIDHYVLDKVWKTKNRDYYPRWRSLLDRADGIDLANRPGARRTYTDDEVEKISQRLSVSTPRRDRISNLVHGSVRFVDRSLGLIGRKLRKTSPGLYRMIRK